jgi:hypothetical protein
VMLGSLYRERGADRQAIEVFRTALPTTARPLVDRKHTSLAALAMRSAPRKRRSGLGGATSRPGGSPTPGASFVRWPVTSTLRPSVRRPRSSGGSRGWDLLTRPPRRRPGRRMTPGPARRARSVAVRAANRWGAVLGSPDHGDGCHSRDRGGRSC